MFRTRGPAIGNMTAEMFTFPDELARAVQARNIDLLQTLLEKADTVYRGENAHKTRTMTSLLYSAVENRDVAIAALLLGQGANVDGESSEWKKPLNIAIEGGDIPTVMLLLDRGASIDITGLANNTPLHYAVEHENIDIVRLLLLNRGANINIQNAEQQTPLHLAASNGSQHIVTSLLDHGASINAQDFSRDSREYYDRLIGRPVIINDSTVYTVTPLHSAVANDRTDVVALLLDRGANIDAVAGLKYTPLLYAVARGAERSVRLLLERGANVLVKNRDGNTALCLAKDARIAALLIAYKPEIATEPCTDGRRVNLDRFRDLRTLIKEISEQEAVRRRKGALLSRVLMRRAEFGSTTSTEEKRSNNSKKRKSRSQKTRKQGR